MSGIPSSTLSNNIPMAYVKSGHRKKGRGVDVNVTDKPWNLHHLSNLGIGEIKLDGVERSSADWLNGWNV